MWEFYSEPKELYHHGIKGQKWGKRNGPPYPLSANKHNAVVKSAKKETGGSTTKMGKMDPTLKKYVITAAAVTAGPPVILATAGYALNRALKASVRAVRRGINRVSDARKDRGHKIKNLDELEKLKTLKQPLSAEDIVKNVNAGFNPNDPSTTVNDSYCTLATELRCRGYDVSAKHCSIGVNPRRICRKMFKTPPRIKWSKRKAYKRKMRESEDAYKARRKEELFDKIVKESGPNSRGAVTAFLKGYDFGHIFNYEVDSKGNVRFFDGQTGKSDVAIENVDYFPPKTDFTFARLDNRELTSRVTRAVRTP